MQTILRELYGIEVAPDLISAVTDAVLEEVAAWQARHRAVHIALGVRADGTTEIPGLRLDLRGEAFS